MPVSAFLHIATSCSSCALSLLGYAMRCTTEIHQCGWPKASVHDLQAGRQYGPVRDAGGALSGRVASSITMKSQGQLFSIGNGYYTSQICVTAPGSVEGMSIREPCGRSNSLLSSTTTRKIVYLQSPDTKDHESAEKESTSAELKSMNQ